MAGNDHKPDGDVDLAVRERLLEAAVDAFAAFGFEGASLRQIAQKAGVAFQLITYYFGSKEDLWIAAVDHLFEVELRAAKPSVVPADDIEKQLREWLKIALHFSIHEPQLRQIMCQEYLAGSERYEKHLKPRHKMASPHFDQLFDQARKQGINVRLSTKEMMLVLRGVMVLAAVMPDNITSLTGSRIDSPRTIEILTDLLANIFISGQGSLALRNVAAAANSQRNG